MLLEFFAANSNSSLVFFFLIVPFKTSSAKIDLACAKEVHIKQKFLSEFLPRGIMCFGRESNPYGHCCPRDFLTTLAFTQAGFILNAKPL